MNNNGTKLVEKEKIVAEKLNGRFAMMGFIASSIYRNWKKRSGRFIA